MNDVTKPTQAGWAALMVNERSGSGIYLVNSPLADLSGPERTYHHPCVNLSLARMNQITSSRK